MLFDEKYYIQINEARWIVASSILPHLPEVQTCVDVGCGPGWFAGRLVNRGLSVIGIDGRAGLIDEARLRVPNAQFATLDVTSSESVSLLAPADLTFCFGLLYHLENPFAAVRNLHYLTMKHLIIETMIAPGGRATFVLVTEGINETQGLTYHAVIPTRTALIKMLYVAGFKSVHRYVGAINHPDFIDTTDRLHRREIFLASKISPLDPPDMSLEDESITSKINYAR
jgi:2-polyprenyl-3-methyl-5-hydroxy-6-metoxy-1,4-benzoquinol methylase